MHTGRRGKREKTSFVLKCHARKDGETSLVGRIRVRVRVGKFLLLMNIYMSL